MPTLSARPTRAGRAVRGPLRTWAWGAAEKQLMPPAVLLQWLIACGRPRPGLPLGSSFVTITKRTLLMQRDPSVIGEALGLLSHAPVPSRAWYVLEGPSQPDVHLETDDAIIVIEGKRTESGPTRTTDWMEPRDQMLRHLDCAHACRGTKMGRDRVGTNPRRKSSPSPRSRTRRNSGIISRRHKVAGRLRHIWNRLLSVAGYVCPADRITARSAGPLARIRSPRPVNALAARPAR